jgi:hypothetical protein
MSSARKVLTMCAAVMLAGAPIWAAPATAKYRALHRVPQRLDRVPHRPAYGAYGYPGPVHRTYGSPGYNPRDEQFIIRQPNGTYIGTDPDPSIRAYMRHDNIGPNGIPSGGSP